MRAITDSPCALLLGITVMDAEGPEFGSGKHCAWSSCSGNSSIMLNMASTVHLVILRFWRVSSVLASAAEQGYGALIHLFLD